MVVGVALTGEAAVQRAGGGKPRCNWNPGWGCSDFSICSSVGGGGGGGWGGVCRELCVAFATPAQDSNVRVAALLLPGTGPLRAGIGTPPGCRTGIGGWGCHLPRQQGWSWATGPLGSQLSSSCPTAPRPQAPPRHRPRLCVTPTAWLVCVGLASVHCLGACVHTISYGRTPGRWGQRFLPL